PPVSWRGIGLDVATFIRSDLAVGLAFGWNVFFDNTTSTIRFNNTDITGNQDRALNVWPTLVTARWFPKISSNRDIQPYIGAGIGGFNIPEDLAPRVSPPQEEAHPLPPFPGGGGVFSKPRGALLPPPPHNNSPPPPPGAPPPISSL